jgi:D-glycero-alpha-D-manno-heptose-7-phosphate kinase
MTRLINVSIAATATIQDAFERLNANQLGVAFVVDESDRVVGCVTDGDIRRQLLKDQNLGAPLAGFMNKTFVAARAGDAREQILKLLDHRVRVVPMLDADGRLADICSREDFQPDAETEVFARARAPARIGFGGGGTDLTHYFVEEGGVIINAAICRYAHASLRKRSDRAIHIYSHDLRVNLRTACFDDLKLNGEMDLIVSVIRLIRPDFGFEMEVAADFPVGSGLGGSAAVASAVIGCFNEFRADPWDRHQIAEMAFQAERLILSIPGGWQDQYATVFGGFNYMEFTAEHNSILPLRLEPRTVAELEESIVLCYSGRAHDSGAIHRSQRAQYSKRGDANTSAERKKSLALEIKRLLLRGDVYSYGQLLNEAWELKRSDSPLVSDSELDQIYDLAMRNGAVGGKLLGAGGGGFFLFFVPPFQRYRLYDALAERGLRCERVHFEETGLRSWKTRVRDSDHSGLTPGNASTERLSTLTETPRDRLADCEQS